MLQLVLKLPLLIVPVPLALFQRPCRQDTWGTEWCLDVCVQIESHVVNARQLTECRNVPDGATHTHTHTHTGYLAAPGPRSQMPRPAHRTCATCCQGCIRDFSTGCKDHLPRHVAWLWLDGAGPRHRALLPPSCAPVCASAHLWLWEQGAIGCAAEKLVPPPRHPSWSSFFYLAAPVRSTSCHTQEKRRLWT